VAIQEAVATRGPWYLGTASADYAQERQERFDFQMPDLAMGNHLLWIDIGAAQKSAGSNVPDRSVGQ